MISSQERRDLIEKLELHREGFLQQLESLPQERLITAWKEGDRTPMGMLLHVIVTERMYRDDWARRARDEEDPDLKPQSAGRSGAPLFEEANQLQKEDLVQRLREERVKTLKFVAGTGDTEFERKGRNTPFGDLTVHQLLKSLYRHDQMHIDEMAGRESRYAITTLDGRRL